MSGIEQVDAAAWAEWVGDTGGALLDVREPHEWEMGVLPDAIRISMGELISRIEELDAEVPLLVVCRSGARSQQVAVYLSSRGFQAANLAGGMKALGMQD
jgi:rhodanese-related sulfurtransferase